MNWIKTIFLRIAEIKKRRWVNGLKVGDVVCDCRFKHLKIKHVGGKDYDCQIELEDGSFCSAMNCCSSSDHKWSH